MPPSPLPEWPEPKLSWVAQGWWPWLLSPRLGRVTITSQFVECDHLDVEIATATAIPACSTMSTGLRARWRLGAR